MKNLFSLVLLCGMMSANSFAAGTVNTSENTHVQKHVNEKRKEVLQDATMAMNQTKEALRLLDEGNKQGAIDKLESAVGKLEVITARDPKLSLAPFDFSVTTSTLLNDLKSVEQVKRDAKNLLAEDRVQDAAAILSQLKSEIDISVASIPLATYPAAMREATRLIDQNKIDQAKDVITTALSTVVMTTTIIPLPVAKADYLLDQAEKLSMKKNRSLDDNKRLKDLVEEGRTELKFAEELGYGQKSDFKNLYTQLDDVLKKSREGKSGEGWFKDIKRSISGIFEKSGHDKKRIQAQQER